MGHYHIRATQKRILNYNKQMQPKSKKTLMDGFYYDNYR